MTPRSLHLPDYKLIVEIFENEITLEGLIGARQWEKEQGWVESGTNVLIIGMQPKISFTPADLAEYVKWSQANLPEVEGSQTGILADTPKEAAVGLIFKSTAAAIRKIELFSTLEAAAQWLNVPSEAILVSVPETEIFDRN